LIANSNGVKDDTVTMNFHELMIVNTGIPSRLELRSRKICRKTMARNHRNCILIAELARFFCGSIISTYLITALMGNVSREYSFAYARFDSLLYWTTKCGLRGCTELLSLPTDRRPRALAIGTRDSRMGDPIVREEISHDRLDVYECLA